MNSKVDRLAIAIMDLGYTSRMRLLLTLDLLDDQIEGKDVTYTTRAALIKARDTGKLQQLAESVAEVTGEEVEIYIDTCELVTHVGTDVFQLDTVDQVRFFCSELVRMKNESPVSTTFTVVVTVDRSTRYRRPLGVLEVEDACNPYHNLVWISDELKNGMSSSGELEMVDDQDYQVTTSRRRIKIPAKKSHPEARTKEKSFSVELQETTELIDDRAHRPRPRRSAMPSKRS